MYQMVAEYVGKKNLKAGDLTKAMIAKHGEGALQQGRLQARDPHAHRLGALRVQLPRRELDHPPSQRGLPAAIVSH